MTDYVQTRPTYPPAQHKREYLIHMSNATLSSWQKAAERMLQEDIHLRILNVGKHDNGDQTALIEIELGERYHDIREVRVSLFRWKPVEIWSTEILSEFEKVDLWRDLLGVEDRIPLNAHFRVRQNGPLWLVEYFTPDGERVPGSNSASAQGVMDWFYWLNSEGYSIDLNAPEYIQLQIAATEERERRKEW